MPATKEIQVDKMAELRELSNKVSEYLNKELTGYVKTITQLFSPRKVLGEFMAGNSKDKVVGSEKNFSFLQERYKSIMKDAFGMTAKLSSIVPTVSSKLSLNQWEYIQQIGDKAITISSPTEWVLTYDSSMNINRLLQAKVSGKTLSQDDVSRLVIDQLTMQLLFENNPGLTRLFNGMGYQVEVRTLADTSGELPYIVLSASVQSFQPQEDVIKMATQFSGSSTFAELIDMDAIENIPHTVKDNLVAHVSS
ncbi:hypothetical protein [Aestuariibacter salexigens]|uniref:hypothetical protein n=1 Tax=Aestuariibacter salexigens TaxID=226010 RepID=UPI00041DE21A|nr:hypothetical protein [Aestuariibacter salexigens]